jgi:C-terminal processing protease CtpA/Prc
LHNIESPEDKCLIIDLRYNTGGLTEAGNRMLDLLLPDCVTSYSIDRDGYLSGYESNKYSIEFEHIFILVNEYTASCAEMFTMSMQRYMDNVTVVGTETYGKGVGQIVFEDKSSQYAIFLVQHYWKETRGTVLLVDRPEGRFFWLINYCERNMI